MNVNIDFEILNQQTDKSGEYRLWLRVLLNSVYEYLYEDRFTSKSAETFLFEDNIYFNLVAESLGFNDPDALRQRIRQAKKRCTT